MLAAIRRIAFCTIDLLKGGKFIKNYREIKRYYDNKCCIEKDTDTDERVYGLLEHAVRTTDFYKKYQDYSTLQDFPVINKTIVREHTDALLSSEFPVGTLKAMTTSGSTGAPLRVYKDSSKQIRHQADNVYLYKKAGLRLGERIYYLRVWNEINKKTSIESWIQNVVIVESGDLSDAMIKGFLNRFIRDSSSKGLLAFASTLEAISRYIERNPGMIPPRNVKAIFSISEALPEASKSTLRKFFNCPVICRYSNIENGFIAQQCIEDNQEYHVNSASYWIELLEIDNDVPVTMGQPGRIVITDLYNRGMPLIRYDTGDIGILERSSGCGEPGLVFKRIEGRKVDFITNTRGALLSPHVITNTMWKYPEVIQFQFIQEHLDQYTLILNTRQHPLSDESQLIKNIKSYTGEDSAISIEYVEEIPVLASGKRKKIISRYLQDHSAG